MGRLVIFLCYYYNVEMQLYVEDGLVKIGIINRSDFSDFNGSLFGVNYGHSRCINTLALDKTLFLRVIEQCVIPDYVNSETFYRTNSIWGREGIPANIKSHPDYAKSVFLHQSIFMFLKNHPKILYNYIVKKASCVF